MGNAVATAAGADGGGGGARRGKLTSYARDGRIVLRSDDLACGPVEFELDDEGADKHCMGIMSARAEASRQRSQRYTPPLSPSDRPGDVPS